MRTRRLIVCFSILVFLPAASYAVVFVDKDAPFGGDGNSWPTAYNSIQSGLDDADILDEEVWVAKGTYSEGIVLRDGVSLYGGFNGYGETEEANKDQRDWLNNKTIIDGKGIALHVVIGANNSIIDGFTITGGYARGTSFSDWGGGIYCNSTSPAI